jgi:cytochrome c551/c552
VSCRSGGNCTAGGYYKDSSGHFQAFVGNEVNGTWGNAIEIPGTATLNTGGEATVISVSCASAGNCAAGGNYTGSHAPLKFKAFVADEVNGTWGNAIEVPGTGNAEVASVSCPSAGNCTVGGSYTGSSGHPQAFVANEVNGTWGNAIEVPGTATLNTGGNAGVISLSCPSAGDCTVGGSYTGSSGNAQAFVADEVNGTWGNAIEVPGTATLNTGGNAAADSVSCASAGNCAAGGNYTVGQAKFLAFVANEVNGTWGHAIEVPGTAALNAGGDATVDSVSCPSAGNCAASGHVAVGSASGISGQLFVVSEVNGTWSDAVQVPGQAPPNDSATDQNSSVSCQSAGNCAATGSQAFVVSEVNGAWGEAVQVPGSGAGDLVNSVSCPPGGCTAGGGTIVTSQN